MTLSHFGRVLVVAPHPDDEILGCGGTIARLAEEGHEVDVCLVTRGHPPDFAEDAVLRVIAEMERAHAHIGVTRTHRLDLPAARLDTVPAWRINQAIGEVVEALAPDTLFLPFVGDIHLDHQLAFLGAMVAARPRREHVPVRILCYETLSETNWLAPPITPAFVPNCFIDIAGTLARKLEAFAMFESQVKEFPDERSLKVIESLAVVRGANVFAKAAEAFVIVRQIEC
nr:PIG-L deacetylase family protein [Novosphingobium profundi]